jgi:hypothetical protein
MVKLLIPDHLTLKDLPERENLCTITYQPSTRCPPLLELSGEFFAKIISFLSLLLALLSCHPSNIENSNSLLCTADPNLRFYTQDEMTAAFRNDIIEKLASSNQTDANGAMDKNKAGYFHVRFQMGKYLDDNESMQTGLVFAGLAMAKKQPEGYFKEGSGYDSSYQGVGLAIGFRLLSVLNQDEPIRQTLYDCLACGTNWETKRIKAAGEINSEGNSRVFAGGETFLGQEKSMAYSRVIVAL